MKRNKTQTQMVTMTKAVELLEKGGYLSPSARRELRSGLAQLAIQQGAKPAARKKQAPRKRKPALRKSGALNKTAGAKLLETRKLQKALQDLNAALDRILGDVKARTRLTQETLEKVASAKPTGLGFEQKTELWTAALRMSRQLGRPTRDLYDALKSELTGDLAKTAGGFSQGLGKAQAEVQNGILRRLA